MQESATSRRYGRGGPRPSQRTRDGARAAADRLARGITHRCGRSVGIRLAADEVDPG